MATIETAPRIVVDVVAAWPDSSTETVTQLRFASVAFGDSGRAKLELSEAVQALVVEGAGESGSDLVLSDPHAETVSATWDAPDLVWVGGILPAHEIGGGVLLSALGQCPADPGIRSGALLGRSLRERAGSLDRRGVRVGRHTFGAAGGGS